MSNVHYMITRSKIKNENSPGNDDDDDSDDEDYEPYEHKSKRQKTLVEYLADIANDNHKNPFTTAISLYGNTGGSIASNTYTVPIRNADGMYLDNDDNELYIIVRYKGDPTPINDITLTFS